MSITMKENGMSFTSPATLADWMCNSLDGNEELILVPFGGKGGLIEAILRAMYNHYKQYYIEICEADPDLEKFLENEYSEKVSVELNKNIAELEGKKHVWNKVTEKYENMLTAEELQRYKSLHRLRDERLYANVRMVHNDFLNFETQIRYDAVIMSPPFSSGEEHLLKALQLMKNGGKITCLLSVDTVQNLATDNRRMLIEKLSALNAEIEYVDIAFTDTEDLQKSSKAAIVRVQIPKGHAKRKSFILADLQKDERTSKKKIAHENPKALTSKNDWIEQAVERYNFEITAGMKLYEEYLQILEFMNADVKSPSRHSGRLITLRCGNTEFTPNGFVEKIRQKYWHAFFHNDEFTRNLTTNLANTFRDLINDAVNYEFCVYNINRILQNVASLMDDALSDTIDALFNKLSEEHSYYPECYKNKHYYDGWTHNRAHMVNTEKVIIPSYGCYNRWYPEKLDSYNISGLLGDIEKTLDYLAADSFYEYEPIDMVKKMEQCLKEGISKNIQLKYYTVTFYKKGTCHIKWNEKTKCLIDKLNIYGAKKRNWLPPFYGKKGYKDCTANEKNFIDEFQGREKYEQVMKNQNFYLGDSKSLLMLG